MAETTTLQPIQTDTWVKASWDEFVATAYSSAYQEGRAYYDRGRMRIEMAALGPAHSRQNSITFKVVSLYAALRNLRIVEFINCSFRKQGEQECQPDIAFYLGETVQLPPQTNTPINVELFGAPTLAVEIGATSFNDDIGNKRLLYERIGVQEYWVVNVAELAVIAFSVAQGRSGPIETSQVLPSLDIGLVELALRRSQTDDDGAITRWLLQSFGNA
jgi:Uma2 family endonuclease